MPVTLVPEGDLREVLRPYRADPVSFEAAIRERLRHAQVQRVSDPLAGLSPLSRAAAAIFPIEIFTGGKVIGATSQLASTGVVYKLLGYLAFPAICMFVLIGATIFSMLKIRNIQTGNDPKVFGEQDYHGGLRQWWRHHLVGVIFVFAATLYLSFIGASSWLFVLYILSLGLLLHLLSSLAKRGLGNRMVIGQSCGIGLGFLAQTAGFSGVGDNEIHFVDQFLLVPILFGGTFSLILFGGGYRFSGQKIEWVRRLIIAGPIVAIALAFFPFGQQAMIAGVTRDQIKSYVETFEDRPSNTATWGQWEIPARWALDVQLNPDLSKPQRILNREIDGEQNPFILGIMFRLGMVRENQLEQLKDYTSNRSVLLDSPEFQVKYPILSLEQVDWVIRAAVLRNDLSTEERDYLARRLILSIEKLSTDEYATLKTALRATKLLEVIDRPIDRDRYRSEVHDLLRESHSTIGGGFQLAGGFKTFVRVPDLKTGSLESTSDAIQLMAIYGIPDGLDLDWVRSYLRTKFIRVMNDKWMAPVLLDRLNHLPGVKKPSWFRILYYERTLLAALVLVAMCFYATLSSPVVQIKRPDEKPA